MNDLRNFNELFRKDMTYDNIKSHKKPRLHPLFEIYIFGLYLYLIYLLPNGGVILTFSLLGVHADFSYVLYKLNVTIILLLNCFSIFNQTLLSSERFLKLFKPYSFNISVSFSRRYIYQLCPYIILYPFYSS